MSHRHLSPSALATALDNAEWTIYHLAGRTGVGVWRIKALLRKAFTPTKFLRKKLYTALNVSNNTLFPVIT